MTATATPTMGAAQFSDVAFANADVGWASGEVCAPGTDQNCDGVIDSTIDGGDSWTQAPVGDLIPTSIDALDVSHVWVLASPSTCLHDIPQAPCPTTVLDRADTGQWQVASSVTQTLSGLSFATPAQGWASVGCPNALDGTTVTPSSCPGEVLVTSDGGDHWHTALSTPGPVVAVDATPGLVWAADEVPGVTATASAAVQILSSVNGGDAWVVRGELPDLYALQLDTGLSAHLLFSGRSDGWLSLSAPSTCAMHGCGAAKVYQTVDGGHQWTPGGLPSAKVDSNCSGSRGLSALAPKPGGGVYLATTDMGANACAPVEAILYAVTASGSWAELHTFDGAGPVALSWPADKRAWAVIGGAVVATTDEGGTWDQQLPAPQPTAAVDFTNATEGWGVGLPSNPGAVLQTNDGGTSWAVVGSVPGQASQVSAVDPAEAVLLDDYPPTGTWSVQKTTTGGAQWSDVYNLPGYPSYEGGPSLLGLSVLGQSAFVGATPSTFQGPGDVLVSSDGGQSWGPARPIANSKGPVGLVGLSFSDPSHGWAVDISTSGGVALQATGDGGETWAPIGTLPSTLTGINTPGDLDVVLNSPSAGWIVVQRMEDPTTTATMMSLLHTTNGGQTWEQLVFPLAIAGADTTQPEISFVSNQDGWLLTGSGLWSTNDGGVTWSYVKS